MEWDGSFVGMRSPLRRGSESLFPGATPGANAPNHFGLTSSGIINVLLSGSGSSHLQANCHMAITSYFLVGRALE